MITCFEDPLPDAEGTEVMLANVWRAVEAECGVDEERTTQIDSHVGNMRSLIPRTLTSLS